MFEYKVYLEDRIYTVGDANAYDEYCAVLDELKKKKKKLKELENKFYSL